jgi:hypothetical protein
MAAARSVDPIALAELQVATDQAQAAWAAVQATWAGAALSFLVLGSAFITVLWQRHLDRQRRERQRQYNNLSVLVESMFSINYIEFCREYMGSALDNGKLVSKFPIIFHLEGYIRTLDLSSAADDVGPGPTSVASRAIIISKEVVGKAREICPNETFSSEQLTTMRRFISGIEADLRSVWEALQHHHQNITSDADGRWAVDEYCRRSRTKNGGRAVIERLKAGKYAEPDTFAPSL